MEWNTQIKCKHCNVEYVVKHNEQVFPNYCPFCGQHHHETDVVTEKPAK